MSNRKKKKQPVLFSCELVLIHVLVSASLSFCEVPNTSGNARAEPAQNHKKTRRSTSNRGREQEIIQSLKETFNNQKKPISAANKSILDRIIDIFRRNKKKGGTRTSSCIILSRSVKKSLQTWSNRPLFVWEGNPKWIGLQSVQTGQLLWSHQVREDEQSVQYDGAIPLERGQDYTYWIRYSPFVALGENDGYQLSFRVMEERDYQHLNRDLSLINLSRFNKTEVSMDIILDRAYYFAQRGLFLDAARELFMEAERSPELENQLEKLQCILSPK